MSTSGILMRREDVRLVPGELFPENVDKRKRQGLRRRNYRNPGTNLVWHIDSHDELKHYDISIHGCIDGYSRCIIWLEVPAPNKMPEPIDNYYLDAVKQRKGKPKIIKADDGTEHSVIEPLHA